MRKDKYDVLSYITIMLCHVWLGRLIPIYGYIDVSLQKKKKYSSFYTI